MNGSIVTEFILLGFSCSWSTELIIFALVLAFYTTILLGNLLIMVTVRSDHHLFHCPMYFFLANLSLLDVSLGSVAAPKLMTDILNGGRTISFAGCIIQICTFHFLTGVEMCVLTLMAYDRYVAICHPLRYMTMMGRQRCIILLLISWTIALMHGIMQASATAHLTYCGPNVLDNFWCDSPQVVKLSCSDVYIVQILMMVSDSVITIPCLLTLLASYVPILTAVSGRFGNGGMKALSTCTSHLIVVCLFYGPIVFGHLRPYSSSQVDKIAAVFYTVITPALNPLIYTLRNQEMKGAMKKLNSRWKLRLQLPGK